MRYVIKISVVALLLGACGYSENEINKFDTRIRGFNEKFNLGLKATGSGLYLHIDTLGKGRPIQINDSIWVSYTLKLLSGKVVDFQPNPIGLPVKNLIKGWQEAVYNLPIGSSLRCLIPPQLGYGQAGKDKIGQDKILYFKMRVVEAK
jgi:FKBP-type peptidyl-prolyl cis-trans isomerase